MNLCDSSEAAVMGHSALHMQVFVALRCVFCVLRPESMCYATEEAKKEPVLGQWEV